MSRPPIGIRAGLAAKPALDTIKIGLELSLEARIEEVDALVIGIRDELIDVQASIILFQNPQRWTSAMKNRAIVQGSMFSLHLEKIIVVASMQALCRLWDPAQKIHKKIGFSDLLSLLDEEMITALEKRTLARLAEHNFRPATLEAELIRVGALRDGLIPRIKGLFDQYNGTNLKATRDGWIAHNDIKYDTNSIRQAMAETIPFFEKTRDCFGHVYAFVKDTDFAWNSVIIPIESDAAKFLDDPPKAFAGPL